MSQLETEIQQYNMLINYLLEPNETLTERNNKLELSIKYNKKKAVNIKLNPENSGVKPPIGITRDENNIESSSDEEITIVYVKKQKHKISKEHSIVKEMGKFTEGDHSKSNLLEYNIVSLIIPTQKYLFNCCKGVGKYSCNIIMFM